MSRVVNSRMNPLLEDRMRQQRLLPWGARRSCALIRSLTLGGGTRLRCSSGSSIFKAVLESADLRPSGDHLGQINVGMLRPKTRLRNVFLRTYRPLDLRSIFEFVDRLVGGNTVPQLYIFCDLEIICGFVNHTAIGS